MAKLFKYIWKKSEYFLFTIFFVMMSLIAQSQAPTHIPREQTRPVDFLESTENIVFFIVIPVLIVILYLVWRRNLRKQREEEEKKQ